MSEQTDEVLGWEEEGFEKTTYPDALTQLQHVMWMNDPISVGVMGGILEPQKDPCQDCSMIVFVFVLKIWITPKCCHAHIQFVHYSTYTIWEGEKVPKSLWQKKNWLICLAFL